MYNNISFTSTIRPVTIPQYKQEVLALENPRLARFPWTINEAVVGENVVTTDVMDCSVCGIKVKDKVFLLHTSPFQEINKDFNRIYNIRPIFEVCSHYFFWSNGKRLSWHS